MKKLCLIFLFSIICCISYSQILEYASSDVLFSKRDKSTGQTIYTEKVAGIAILRFDEKRQMAIFYLSNNKTTLTFTNLAIGEQQGFKLAVGIFKSRKITIMFADKDKTVSVIFTDGNIQEGYVLQSISKKTIKGLFEKYN